MFLKTENLSFKYMTGTQKDNYVIKGLNLSVTKGEFIGLIGSSGAGKTTLLQLLSGMILPTEGDIFIQGINTKKKSEINKLRQNIGIVFQNPEQQLFADTVFQDVAFGPRNLGFDESEIENRVEESLEMVGLDYDLIKEASPFSLSGGEMRRVALAGIIAMKPQVLLLDEPTAGLDPGSREDFLSFMDKLNKEEGMTIILVSHCMEEIARFAERILVLHDGKLIIDGSKNVVFDQELRLQEVGLDLPQVTLFMKALASRGKKVRTDVFNIEDAGNEIINFMKAEAL